MSEYEWRFSVQDNIKLYKCNRDSSTRQYFKCNYMRTGKQGLLERAVIGEYRGIEWEIKKIREKGKYYN